MKTKNKPSIPSLEVIHEVLPQTQCTLCDYPGCAPYAEAMRAGEAPIDRCASGGIPVLEALGKCFNQDTKPMVNDLLKRAVPPKRAVIDPSGCIGCGKCIPVCPTNAIVGTAKSLHAVIETDCSGCGLCIPACPTDCIEQENMPDISLNQAKYFRSCHEQTLKQRAEKTALIKQKQQEKKQIKTSRAETVDARKAFIEQIKIQRLKQQDAHHES